MEDTPAAHQARPYDAVLAANIRAERNRKALRHTDVVARMHALGFGQWHRQTVSNVERGQRRITVVELLGLSVALEVPIAVLTDPTGSVVALPNGAPCGAFPFAPAYGPRYEVPAVAWKDNRPVSG